MAYLNVLIVKIYLNVIEELRYDCKPKINERKLIDSRRTNTPNGEVLLWDLSHPRKINANGPKRNYVPEKV